MPLALPTRPVRIAAMSESLPRGFTVWLTGLSGAGKTTVAGLVSAELERRGVLVDQLDGDAVRRHISADLGFSKADRDANIARISWVASRLTRAGAAVVVSAISPFAAARSAARALVEPHGAFVEVYVAASVEVCARRDIKGLYERAFRGELADFTGVTARLRGTGGPRGQTRHGARDPSRIGCDRPRLPRGCGTGLTGRSNRVDASGCLDRVSRVRGAVDPDDLLDSLREENEELLVRVAHLEATRDEYRRQMEGLLTSSSWRVTAPMRSVAAAARLARRRIRELPGRFAEHPTPAAFSTAGLFPPEVPPPGGLVTAASPLLAHPQLATGRRHPSLEGSPSDARILVVAHVYYPEIWFDLEDRLVRIPEPYDLVISLVEGCTEVLEPEIATRLPHAMIHRIPNLGRDLGSLVDLAGAGLFDDYDAILKVHTKRSPHRIDGDAWRVALLDALMPSPEGIRRFVELLRRDRSVGLVVPSGSLHGPETWGSNQVLVEALAARIPFAFDPDVLRYPAGSMYWARPWVLRRLADLRLGREHFEPEASHVDGSTAHALERFVGVAAQASGLDVVDAAAVGRPVSWWHTSITPRSGSTSKIGSSGSRSPTTSWSRSSKAAPRCSSPRSPSGCRTR